ncbi:MAG: UDP-N-acetylglucosamine--N-acetylmuramyl-(pentapeptide) pyrophosphoryl-undecaprenol N-acetylglucosamine transferase [Candidatus Dojkabacteria bacterium]|nr:MAG: UDP-N-acetylglucosamine--N-acetylmuramyl-(pentapeptide) pyrophosphoryl-undecaprenol N-acetylglucosamine transferase [Candidatus Dojkabacteria bacterium]
MNKTKILITGGHLTPALAVLDELIARGYNKIIWVGAKYNQTGNKNPSAEYNIITSKNIKFYNLKAGKLSRVWSLKTLFPSIKNLLLIFVGIINAILILKKEKPQIIVSFGGYIALPIVLIAKLMNIKIVTHEQTVVVGLANKIISKFADRVFVSWKESLEYFPKNKTILTGNPLRKEILKPPSNKTITKFKDKVPLIFITGGNQGAHFINQNIFSIIDELIEKYNVLHQTGNSTVTNDYQKALNLQKEFEKKKVYRYKAYDYLNSTEMSEALKFSDIVIARAGANTITELAYLNKKSILVPIPWVSNQEQYKNAKFLEQNGITIIMEQNDNFNSYDILKNIEKLLKVKQNKKINVPSNAAIKICDEIEKLL